jgi:DNA (cytosine-5)-methyltransferase 1
MDIAQSVDCPCSLLMGCVGNVSGEILDNDRCPLRRCPMLTVGSLFSGIGGFDLGLERAGFEISWQVEIDPYCQRVLAKHWPGVQRYGDIAAMDWAPVPRVDLLCGGFPCQDLSYAGKRAGIDGARSRLWSEYVRAISQLRPRYVLVENVPGLLTNPYMGRVLGDLAACGYDAEWDCLPASAVGAPHRRDRVWIVAYPRSEPEHRSIFATNGQELGRESTIRSSYWQFFTMVPGISGRFGPWRQMGQPGLVRIDNGIPDVLDRLKSIGNAIVPQIAEALGRMILQSNPETAAPHGA